VIKKKKKILAVFGTRPEAIKLAPILQKNEDIEILFTSQHYDLATRICDELKIAIDHRVITRDKYTLAGFMSDVSIQLEHFYNKIKPDIVLVHGDTMSAYLGALIAWMQGIDVAHVEAGLRTDTLTSPFPEEFFRRSIDMMARYQFAPTQKAFDILKEENRLTSKDTKILKMTGNTIVDIANKLKKENNNLCEYKNFVLVTLHRKENIISSGIIDIYEAIETIAINKQVVMIEHPNPILMTLSQKIRDKITIIPPVNYNKMINLISNCDLIISDSGGLSEEAVCLNKPIIITRTKTERQEAIDCGIGILAGCDKDKIIDSYLNIDRWFRKNSRLKNPFGDGQASSRIINILKGY